MRIILYSMILRICRTSLQRYSENCRIENYMQSISRCETLVNYSGLYEEEKGIEKGHIIKATARMP